MISAVLRETVCLPFFGEDLADSGGLFRGEVRHANFEGAAVMSTLIFFSPRRFLISLSRKCRGQTFVISVSLNFVSTSHQIFKSLQARRFESFAKLNKSTLSVGFYSSSLVVKRNTAIII